LRANLIAGQCLQYLTSISDPTACRECKTITAVDTIQKQLQASVSMSVLAVQATLPCWKSAKGGCKTQPVGIVRALLKALMWAADCKGVHVKGDFSISKVTGASKILVIYKS
jgi:hypothetical protein